jgi:2-polyprenyl-3-methyl-5-hydroxy-6-metoxy-1,4-benzoquinol methylase
MAVTIKNNVRLDNCPLCHSKDIYFTGALLKYSTPLYFSSEEIRLEEDPEMYRCRSCESGFIQNIISESDFHSLYEKGNSAAVWSNTPFDDDKTKQVKSELQKLFFQGASVLDVGCNVGMLLDYCKKSGCRTAGVELSESSRLILRQKQHSVYSTIESISEKFDIIFAFDLIEHLHAVPAFMTSVASMLNDGGKCIILTGNINSISARLCKEKWWYILTPEHIVFPSRNYFASLKDYMLEKFIPVYNAINYKYSFFKMIRGIAGNLILKNSYNGTPSIGPDHMLVILTKINQPVDNCL